LVLGCRLDIRQTGSAVIAFKAGRVIYHVDIEEGEINNRLQGCKPVIAHLRPFLTGLVDATSKRNWQDRADWLSEIQRLRSQWPDINEIQAPGINPNAFMHELSRTSKQASAFVVDVGNHQMWAAQSLELGPDQRFLTSGGMGAMGFALPAAIGTCLASPGQPVVMIAGDGSFQLNIQELQTVVANQLPIKMVIINNRCYGMVRQFQQSYFEERYQSTYWGYSAPDFSQVARAYGIAADTVNSPIEVQSALEQMWRDPKCPFLLQVMIDTFANVYPKIAFGRPITEMEPFAKPRKMEGT
jgi:acetolactate synthase-1/2/3 large subunit